MKREIAHNVSRYQAARRISGGNRGKTVLFIAMGFESIEIQVTKKKRSKFLQKLARGRERHAASSLRVNAMKHDSPSYAMQVL